MRNDAYFDIELHKYAKFTDLKPRTYNCIFDEENECYDISKPHKHYIFEIKYLDLPKGHVATGYAIRTEVGWIYGIKQKHLDWS